MLSNNKFLPNTMIFNAQPCDEYDRSVFFTISDRLFLLCSRKPHRSSAFSRFHVYMWSFKHSYPPRLSVSLSTSFSCVHPNSTSFILNTRLISKSTDFSSSLRVPLYFVFNEFFSFCFSLSLLYLTRLWSECAEQWNTKNKARFMTVILSNDEIPFTPIKAVLVHLRFPSRQIERLSWAKRYSTRVGRGEATSASKSVIDV